MPGGGVALVNAIAALDGLELEYPDENTGIAILRRALEAPLKKIAANGGEDGGVILAGVRQEQIRQKNNKIGFNVMTSAYVDMIKEGIIDPAKVTRGALENAASIAAMILTTEALITDMPEKHPASMPEGMPMY